MRSLFWENYIQNHFKKNQENIILTNQSDNYQTNSLVKFGNFTLLIATAIFILTQWTQPASANHGLPIVPGFEAGHTLVTDNCLLCHNADRFTDKIRSGWEFTVDRMQDKPGYPNIHTPAEETDMVDYLMQIHALAVPPPNVGNFIELEQLSTELFFPLAVKNAGDGTGWIYVVGQFGKILIYDGTQLLPTPFLDISAQVTAGGEQGLLDIEFHPDYINNGFFYIHYNDLIGDTIIARYERGVDPAQADPNSSFVIFTTDQTTPFHNGGQLEFGPDGYLYIALGDGGVSGDDPANTAQDLNSYLGKLLRIDVDNGSPYSIPPDNPFISVAGAFPEIWSYGLRNPFRVSFDRETGDMFIGDVGNNNFEEVNFLAAGDPGGQNYGWPIMEGNSCLFVPNCDPGGILTLPILEYSHASEDCSVIGGYRYRGNKYPQMDGIYFYGDLCSGKIRGATQDINGNWQSEILLDTINVITSFGEDEDGELYMVDFTGFLFSVNQIFTPKLINDFAGDFNSDLLMYNPASGETFAGLLSAGVLQSGNMITTLDVVGGDTIHATGDFNGDKKSDILSYNTITGEIETLLLDDGVLLSTNAILTVNPLSNFRFQGTGDFNGDGNEDIIMHNAITGEIVFIFLDPTGTALMGIEFVVDIDVATDWTLNNTGDFNGDGRDDLLLYNTVSGGIAIIFVDGSTVLSFAFLTDLDPASGWFVQSTADFNSDGKTDLLLYNPAGGQLATMLLDGATVLFNFSLYTLSLADQETVINVSDYNGDGKVDLLTHSLSTAEVKVIFLDGNNAITSIQGVTLLDATSGFTLHSGKP